MRSRRRRVRGLGLRASHRPQAPSPPPALVPPPPRRYRAGQRFGKHIDESNDLGGGVFTVFTLLLYLSSCRGGETAFYGPRGRQLCAVAPQPGMALLHMHGDDCLEHEGAAVTGGEKWVLRSDVAFRRRR